MQQHLGFVLSPSIVFERVGHQWLALSPDRTSVHRLDGAAAEVISCLCDERLPLPLELLSTAADLAALGLLVPLDSGAELMSRRAALWLAVGGAVGVTTLALPSPAAATSGLWATARLNNVPFSPSFPNSGSRPAWTWLSSAGTTNWVINSGRGSRTVDILVVSGGGGGSSGNRTGNENDDGAGSGGGGGTVHTVTGAVVDEATTLTIVVGGGGAGNASNGAGTAGGTSNVTWNSGSGRVRSYGGRGGAQAPVSPNNAGSGGGIRYNRQGAAAGSTTTGINAGTFTSSAGVTGGTSIMRSNVGGDGYPSSGATATNKRGGGGGGAGGAGTTATASVPGDGGLGFNASDYGLATIGGGGGGGSGSTTAVFGSGNGGGGNGARGNAAQEATTGTANTGGGGGGGGLDLGGNLFNAGKDGGSGIVVILGF